MRRTVAVLAVCGLVSLPLSADDAVAPQPPARDGFLKRTVRSFFTDDASAPGRGLHLGPLLPRLEVVSSGGGIAPVLHLWAPDIGRSPLDFHASAAWSTRSYQYYDLSVGLIPHQGEALAGVERGTSPSFPLSDIEKGAAAPGFGIWAAARYRDYPGEDFYGLGSRSTIAARTDYRLRDASYEGVAQLRVARVTVMARAGLLRTAIAAGTDSGFPDIGLSNDDVTAPGLLRAPDFVRLGAGVWFEARDEPGNPHRGIALGVAVSRFDDRGARAFQWNRLSVDARQYVALGSRRHVVALRQVALLDDPDSGGSRVPFYLQPTLGGSGVLRGYSTFRFRDDKLVALAAEYRFELRRTVELALIHEAGQVSATIGGFGLGELRHSYGAGLRLKSPHKVKLRVDVLHGAEGTRVNLKLGPAF